MSEHFWLGMAIILLSGAFNGSFPLPMKYSRQWQWENTWLVFALTSLLILPGLLAVAFVPGLPDVYRGVPARALFLPMLFGFLWGIAQVTFGIAIKAVGMAVAFAVVSGLVCLSGSLVPLLVFHPTDLFSPRGMVLFVSMPILFLGLVIYGAAGRRREKEQARVDSTGSAAGGSFMTGLAICIFTGIFGSNFNLGFVFSNDIIRRSQELGATQVTSTYAAWAPVLAAGFIPNLLYCLYLLFRNHNWSLFARTNWEKEILLGMAMGVLWVAGIFSYGVGATLAGKYGTSLGFVLFIAASVLSSNLFGLLTGEWASTTPATKRLLAAGMAAVLVSVVVLNLGGIL